ncbi:MAG: glycosyltransferase family 4 protein [Planctomycetota bacterium]
MRIARVLTRLNLGGPARQVLASDPILVARGRVVRVFAGAPEPGEGALDGALERSGIQVVRVPGLRRSALAALTGGDARAVRFLRSGLAAFDPDVVHTHASKAGALGRRAARAAAPRAARVHTFHGHVLEGYFPGPVSLVLRRLEARLARTTDRVLAVSAATRDDLVRLGVAAPESIEVVPPGVALEGLLALPVDRPDTPLRRDLGIGPDELLVGVIGRMAPVKRVRLALDVFARLADEFRGLHIAFAGDGPDRRALESRVAALPSGVAGRVHLLGPVPDVVPLHAALDALLSTSFAEGMPVAMIEAAAAARPVVSTAVGGVPELVRSGVTGLLGTDVDGLAAALGALLGDAEKRTELGLAARERARSAHSAEALADRLEAVYAGMLRSRP